MTLRPTASRKAPRWLALLATVMALSVFLGVATAFAAIPNGYTVVVDEHGANDVPGQVDVTQMGVMASESPNLRIFWSWDSISAWTGTGQTGDACALFDTIGANGDADAFINYVVCARVNNPTAAPSTVQIAPAATNKPVYIFDCSNKKFDRCTNPAPRTYAVGDVVAGPFGNLSASGAGDLINNSDPFNAAALNGPGESYPNDSSIDIRILSTLVPAGVKMVNVCSYPSAGNGGNNNPFDCIRTPGAGTLIVNKVLPNNSGGTKTYGDFGFTVGSGSATTGVASSTFDGDGSISVSVTEGTYSVIEVPTSTTGYTTTYANTVNGTSNGTASCASLSVTAGGTTICTITNDDNPGSLQIVKRVTNDNGGNKTVTDFSVATDAGTLSFGTGSVVGSTTTYTATALSVSAGTYSLTESNVAGYTEGSWSCTGGTANPTTFSGGSVFVANGATVVCTITNNDDAGSLQIVKRVTNDNGGTRTVSDFGIGTNAGTLSFDAGSLSGSTTTYTATAISVSAGAYTLTESDVTGYAEGSWSCPLGTNVTSTFSAGSVTVPNGVAVVCIITNNDDAGSLQIVKRVTNDNGGSKTVSDFGIGTNAGTLSFDTGSLNGSTRTYTATAIPVSAGAYTLTENDVAGYTEGSWSCPLGTNVTSTFGAGSVTVPNGVAVVCTITNNDDAGSLQIVKRVVNDNGGTKTVADFNLDTDATADPLAFDAGSADGASTIKYTATALTVNAGTYSLTESDVALYTEGSWSCPLGSNVTSTFSAGSVTVPNGVAVVCTITNNDDKALPSGSTAQSYILKDSLVMSGLRTGATTPGTLTFRLWSTKTGDVCSDQVGSDLVVTNIVANTTYAPSSGIAVTDADTYYWTVQYSGDQFNTGFTTACGSESTTISKFE